ncbi:MAG: flagellar biosynthesis protein FlhB [Oscillospiraceae bacterium]|nr:flagellar biosynthesis protein FlhB [Oscillospiraceae bacterium]
MAGDSESKTEKATPKKRRDERKKGNVLMSRDVVGVATLLGSLVMLRIMGGIAMGRAETILSACFNYIREGEAGFLPGIGRELLVRCLVTVVVVAGPFLLVTLILAIAATFAQTRMLVTTEPLKPKLSKLNPLEGFKRMFSLRSVVELFKNLIKFSILLYLIFDYFKSVSATLTRFLDMDVSQAVSILFDDIFNLVLRVVIAFIVVAFFDYLYQWWDYERKLRMSKQEIKEEYKQTEGDPQVKGKIKQIQRERAQQRMMQQVPGADVVIRNPTHVAVALRYKPEKDSAPVMVAKGVDELALRIVKTAEEHDVAVIENVPLARSLYASIDLDREITPDFYGPVAEILVYVLKLDQQPPPQ